MSFRRYLALLPLVLCLAACGKSAPDAHTDPAEDVAKTNLVQVGDPAPPFEAELLGGGVFDLSAQRGKVVLVNFFATWCPPCQAEMPHLQTQVWERFDGSDFAMVSVAREETADIVAPFVAKYGSEWPFALDPDRTAFAKYATAYIPRSYILDRQGKVVFQSQGYEEAEFAAMVAVIAAELARTGS